MKTAILTILTAMLSSAPLLVAPHAADAVFDPCGFGAKPNGHLLIACGEGDAMLELDEQKRIVRQFSDHARFVSINKVHLLDVPGDPVKGGEVWR